MTATKRITATFYAVTLPDGSIIHKRSFRWHQQDAVATGSARRDKDGKLMWYDVMIWPNTHAIQWQGEFGVLKATRVDTQ